METFFDDINIIDAHVHIPSSDFFLPEFYEPITRNMITAMKSYFPSLNEKIGEVGPVWKITGNFFSVQNS